MMSMSGAIMVSSILKVVVMLRQLAFQRNKNQIFITPSGSEHLLKTFNTKVRMNQGLSTTMILL